MLVFSRAKGESLMVGDDIEVQVVEVRGDKVRLGIVCSKETSVHRQEVFDAIQRENQRRLPNDASPRPAEEE